MAQISMHRHTALIFFEPQLVLQDWVDAYQQNRASATAELLTLLTQVLWQQHHTPVVWSKPQHVHLLAELDTICTSVSPQLTLQASGCATDVTEDNVEEGEVDKLVKGLVQQVSQVSCASDMHSRCTKMGLLYSSAV